MGRIDLQTRPLYVFKQIKLRLFQKMCRIRFPSLVRHVQGPKILKLLTLCKLLQKRIAFIFHPWTMSKSTYFIYTFSRTVASQHLTVTADTQSWWHRFVKRRANRSRRQPGCTAQVNLRKREAWCCGTSGIVPLMR